jgi:hypothetical protein
VIGCGNTATTDETHSVITRTERQFEGADREHAKFSIALAASLSSKGYLLAKYVDDETGSVFSPQHLEQFARDGFLPQGMYLKRVNLHAGWRIDARVYRHGGASPNTPWFYDHCFLQYYGVGPISGDDFVKIKNEWRHTRTAFGQAFHDAGDRLLHIAQKVHADPERHVGTPFIDVRRSKESSDYLEFLGFAAGYWLHVFLTDAKDVKETSIITVSFSARSDDDPNIPPHGAEDLLTSPLFGP